MKRLTLISILASGIVAMGCSSNKAVDQYDEIYADRHQCNGDMEISQTMVIVSNDSDEVTGPEVKATCTPKVYDPRTDFEKENRRGNF